MWLQFDPHAWVSNGNSTRFEAALWLRLSHAVGWIILSSILPGGLALAGNPWALPKYLGVWLKKRGLASACVTVLLRQFNVIQCERESRWTRLWLRKCLWMKWRRSEGFLSSCGQCWCACTSLNSNAGYPNRRTFTLIWAIQPRNRNGCWRGG